MTSLDFFLSHSSSPSHPSNPTATLGSRCLLHKIFMSFYQPSYLRERLDTLTLTLPLTLPLTLSLPLTLTLTLTLPLTLTLTLTLIVSLI